MYMVKRVFKNKRLIRNLFILAGLVIVGFFVWRAFFSRTSLLEGNDAPDVSVAQETSQAPDVSVAQPTSQGPTQAVAQPTTQGPTQAVAQPTTQGSATATCPPGAGPPGRSTITKTYPDEKDARLPIPPGTGNCTDFKKDWTPIFDGSPTLHCQFPDWRPARAACNQHIPTWENCAEGQKQYNACINS